MSGLLPACLLLGSLHGVVLAVVLWRRATHRHANQWLAGLLVSLAGLLLDGHLATSGGFERHPHLVGLAAPLPFVFGPFLFLYVRDLTDPAPVRRPRAALHFVPFLADVVVMAIFFYGNSAAEKRQLAAELSAGGTPWYVDTIDGLKFVQGFAYVGAALVLLSRHGAHVRALYSDLATVSLRWLKVLVALNTAVWLVAFALFGARLIGVHPELESLAPAAVAVGTGIVVFVIGYFQLGQVVIFAAPTAAAAPAAAAPAPAAAAPAPAEAPPAAPYQRARLAADDASELEARLHAAMREQRLYQRAGLTLAQLAEAIAATPHELSQLLSTRLDSNFYALVNQHRVEHAKAALADPRRRDVPVLDLAFEAGFSSKSTFNAAFRKATGLTPSAFRERALGGRASA